MRMIPAFWAIENKRVLQWNEALSITTTHPFSRTGRSWLENQNSNKKLSIVPSYCKGARILPFICATPLVLAAADPAGYFLTPGRIAVFPVQVRIDPTLIHVRDPFFGISADLRLIRRYFFLVLLPVPGCLFLRVIFRRFIARWIATALHPNSSAISF